MPTKVHFLTNERGEIVATAWPEAPDASDDNPPQVGLVASAGRLVSVLAVRESFLQLPPQEMHHKFRVTPGGAAKLTPADRPRAKPAAKKGNRKPRGKSPRS